MSLTHVDLGLVLDAKVSAFRDFAFVGTSTDEKPTTLPDGSDLPDGAEFYEKDTGRWWDWDAATDALIWTLRPRDTGTDADVDEADPNAELVALQKETNSLLRRLLSGIAMLNSCDAEDIEDPAGNETATEHFSWE